MRGDVVGAAKYRKLKKLGSGSFGTVFLVEDASRARFVLKEVDLRGLPLKEQRATMNEVKVLQRLRHKHIVSYHDSFISAEGRLCIIMEWAAGGDIGALIAARKKAGKRFTEAEILRLLHQMASALAYCHHEAKLLHRDLKPANIFLGANGEVKVGDFGTTTLILTLTLTLTPTLTPTLTLTLSRWATLASRRCSTRLARSR